MPISNDHWQWAIAPQRTALAGSVNGRAVVGVPKSRPGYHSR